MVQMSAKTGRQSAVRRELIFASRTTSPSTTLDAIKVGTHPPSTWQTIQFETEARDPLPSVAGWHDSAADSPNAVVDYGGERLYVVIASEVERLAHRTNVSFHKQRANIGLKAR